MNKVEAMEWAADFAERTKMFEAPRNERGYVADGAKILSAGERSRIIIELAATVIGDDAVTLRKGHVLYDQDDQCPHGYYKVLPCE